MNYDADKVRNLKLLTGEEILCLLDKTDDCYRAHVPFFVMVGPELDPTTQEPKIRVAPYLYLIDPDKNYLELQANSFYAYTPNSVVVDKYKSLYIQTTTNIHLQTNSGLILPK